MKAAAYYNTTNVSGDQLARYLDVALSQESRLLAYFEQTFNRDGSYAMLTPSTAQVLVFANKIPITSVRRALSNLTRDGYLRKSGQATGLYGRPENYWRLVERSPQKQLF